MKHYKLTSLVPWLLLSIVIIGLAAGCATAATTTPAGPGGPGGGSLVRNDSVVTVRIESLNPRGDGITDMTVYLVSTENVGDEVNPVSDKVGQVFAVWTDEDIAMLTMGVTVTGHIQLAGDVELGTTFRLSGIAVQ